MEFNTPIQEEGVLEHLAQEKPKDLFKYVEEQVAKNPICDQEHESQSSEGDHPISGPCSCCVRSFLVREMKMNDDEADKHMQEWSGGDQETPTGYQGNSTASSPNSYNNDRSSSSSSVGYTKKDDQSSIYSS